MSVHAKIVSAKYSSFYLFYNLIHLSAMLGFCRMYVRLKITKEQKTCFKTLDKGRRWEHFMLRVRRLILASGRDYDKYDAQFVSYFTSPEAEAYLSHPLLAMVVV